MHTENIQTIKNLSFKKIIGEIDDYAILLLNKDGLIESWNSGAEKIKGYKSEEIIGKHFSVFYTEKDKSEDKPQKILAKVRADGKAKDEGWRMRKDGTTFWASVSITAIHDDDNNILGFTKVTRDLTINKAEEYLTKVNNRFKISTEAAEIGIWDWDIPGNALIWDDTMFDIYKIESDSFTGSFEDWEKTVHPEDLEKSKREIMLAFENKKEFNTEFRIIWPDESIRYIKARGRVQFDSDGNAIRMLGSNWDISAQKYAEIDTRASKEKYKALIENLPNACFLSKLNGEFLDVNQVACEMFGFSSEEFKSMSLNRIIETGDKRLVKYLKKLKKGGKIKGDLIGIRKDKERFYLEIAGVLYKDTFSGEELVNIVMTDITDRKKMERLLKDTNQMATVGGWEVDMLNNTIYWSKVTREIHEVSDDFEPVLETAINFYKEGKSREDITVAVNQCIISGTPFDLELQIITAAGKEKWVRSMGRGEFQNGKIIRLFGAFQDINEKKLITQQLEKSKENLQKIMDHSLDIICTIDSKGEFVQISAASEKVLGYTPEELIGVPFITLVYEEDHEITLKAAEDIASGVSTTNFENRYVRKDGNLVPIIWSVIWDDKDKLFYCIARDATEKKKAESLLRESEKKINDLALNVPGVVYQLCVRPDGSSYFTYVSEKVEETFGFTSDFQSSQWNLGNRIPEEEKEGFFNSVQKAVTEISNWDYEGRIICGNGEIKWFQGKSVPLKVGDDIVFNGIMLDITKRKRVELEREQLIKELSQNNTELKQFSYITSHNLRAPITNLIGIHQLLDTTKIEDERTRRLINGLKASTTQLNDTLNDLIKILIIKENINLSSQMIDIKERYNKVVSSISSFIKQSGAKINSNFKEVPQIKFNKEYMDSILLNLIINAIKYAHPERSPIINISTRKREGKIQLIIQDNGLGLNMEKVKNKIFGLYQRFHNHPNSKGIGLYLVHSQVTSLGGNIEVASEEEIGTTFTITFK